MPANILFDGPKTNLPLVLCILIEILSCVRVKRREALIISDFALLMFVFKVMPRRGNHCSERVNRLSSFFWGGGAFFVCGSNGSQNETSSWPENIKNVQIFSFAGFISWLFY